MLTTSAAVPVNVLSLRLRYAVTHRVRKLARLDVRVIAIYQAVPLIARTRAVLYGESWPVANYRFASLSPRRTSVYIYNPVNRAALYFKTRLSRHRALPSPLLASSLR